jgi:hypothetical protein
MAQYTNYLARKVNGPVAQALLKGAFNTFNEAEDWLLYRTHISIASASTDDLKFIGEIIGAPRPYAVVDDEVVFADDATYRRFLLNIAYLKRSKSVIALGEMLSQFIPNGLFELRFTPIGDIRVVVDKTYESYLPFLQQAVSSIYTAAPRVQPFESRDFDRFIFDNGLYYYYIMLRDPGTWDWEYDESEQRLSVSVTKPNRIVLNVDPEDTEHIIPQLFVLSEV